MASPPAPLTEAEKEQFRNHGYLRLKNCFTKEQADWVIDGVWTRLGMDPNDKSTWSAERTNMPHHKTFDMAEFAPKAWAAICELCGGEDRVDPNSRQWKDSLIVNLGTAEREGEHVAPQALPGWHVDGDFFIHYLDSPEQALLVTPMWSNVVPSGGGTVICPEAIPKVAKHLHDHPEGVSPWMAAREDPVFKMEKGLNWFSETIQPLNDFVEVTGDVGDVFLCHPLMMHSATTNPLRQIRIITNPPVSVKEPFVFDRPDGNYSMVELATLKALGKDSLPGWTTTAPREGVVPRRVRIQAEMKEKELKRLEEVKKASVAV